MITKPEGTQDLIGNNAEEWQQFVKACEAVFENANYSRIEIPMFEKEELFVRGIGEVTDVVNKEMFSVFSGGNLAKMKAGEELSSKSKFALRPEGTAGVVRAAIENGLLSDAEQQPFRVWYAGSMFRAERPQRGRLREFHQVGLECIGSDDAFLDAQAVMLMLNAFSEYGIDNSKIEMHLNTMGCDKCRPAWRSAVKEHIDAHASEMCETCRERAEKNPLRAFDCKNENCKGVMRDALKIDEFLCEDCRSHFDKVKLLLGLSSVSYVLDPTLVRGLDYYTRTVFEAQFNEGMGAQNAIGGGGRYDGLVKELDAKSVSALGFAIGFERCLLAKEAYTQGQKEVLGPAFFFISLCEAGREYAEKIAMRRTHASMSFDMDFRPVKAGEPQFRSLKSQLRLANKTNAQNVVILGEDEMKDEMATIKSLATHEDKRVPLKNLEDVDFLEQLLLKE